MTIPFLRARWMLGLAAAALVVAATAGLIYLSVSRPGGGAAHPAADCISCHREPNPEAALYVAADGEELPSGRILYLEAGGSLELDFHFTNMVYDTERFNGVGAEIVLPDEHWFIGPGTLTHPEGWSPSGQDATLWDFSWDRSTNGDGPVYARWSRTDDAPASYYLDFAGIPWRTGAYRMVANDRGEEDSADRDGLANHMGADALIGIPAGTEAGRYEITIAGIGHDPSNRPAQVSRTVTVEVYPPSVTAATEPGPTAASGEELYRRRCSGCHGASPNAALISKVESMTEGQVRDAVAAGEEGVEAHTWSPGSMAEAEAEAIVSYVLAAAQAGPPGGAPRVPHRTVDREACLSCHGKDSDIPVPATHAYGNDQCPICHQPALVAGAAVAPHPLGGFEACLSCHGTLSLLPLPSGHRDRGEDSCTLCHEVPAGEAPGVPHPLETRQDCLKCHAAGGIVPSPPDHREYTDAECRTCHRPSAFVEAPGIPHPQDGFEACMGCHEPGGPFSVPSDHKGRSEATCDECHRPLHAE